MTVAKPSAIASDSAATTDTISKVARTAYGEARGCGAAGMHNVISVIVNRAAHPLRMWGDSLSTVCTAPYQFSCWNTDDPNRAKLLAVTDRDPEFRIALALAKQAVAGTLPDLTNGADSYFAIGSKIPNWAAGHRPVYSDGWQTFYRLYASAPQGPTPAHVPAMTTDALNDREYAKISHPPV